MSNCGLWSRTRRATFRAPEEHDPEEKLIRDIETAFDSIRQNRRGRLEWLTREIRQGLDSLSEKIREISDDTVYLTPRERTSIAGSNPPCGNAP